MDKLVALVDCNNFYVSCERLFRPELQERPVVVLSNNDGCIIARSNEAKALGIDMAVPYFKNKELLRRHKVEVFSSNYALYGDLSARVMTILQEMESKVEVYSIDEAFISLPVSAGFDEEAYAEKVQEKILKCVGISVSIGIGPTKTLAKIANRIAKKDPVHGGVFRFSSGSRGDKLLAQTGVRDIWGIGRRSTEKLQRYGIINALQLKNADPKWLRKQLTVTGARTALELNGVSCIKLDHAPASRKSVLSSRSFKKPVTSLADLKEAVATYTAIASAKLRSQHLVAGAIQVFISTNRFDKRHPYYANSKTITLPEAGAHTPTFISKATKALAAIYRKDLAYQKAGVMLIDLCDENCRQQNLFAGTRSEAANLMTALDSINQRWGRNTLQYAAEGINKPWSMRQDFKSPAYTTSWSELPLAHCR